MSSMWTATSDLDYYEQFNPEPPEEPEPEPELITEEEVFEAMAEQAGDRAYDEQEEYRLFPAKVGPFPAPVVRIEAPLRPQQQQGKLFEEVA
jgi:hypothetical protein